jgi:DNA-binding beta-propeller fold protein YncE
MQLCMWLKPLKTFIVIASILTRATVWAAISNGPSSSGPIAVSPGDGFVWVVNPDSDSLSVINVRGDATVPDSVNSL